MAVSSCFSTVIYYKTQNGYACVPSPMPTPTPMLTPTPCHMSNISATQRGDHWSSSIRPNFPVFGREPPFEALEYEKDLYHITELPDFQNFLEPCLKTPVKYIYTPTQNILIFTHFSKLLTCL